MKKALLVLLCLVMLGGAVSCNKSNGIYLENSHKEQFLEGTTYDYQTNKSDEERLYIANNKIDATFDSYNSIINIYKKMVEITPDVIEEKEIYNEKVESLFIVCKAKMDWFSQLTKSISELYPRDSSGLRNDGYVDFGYALKDINGDNSDELILMLSNGTIIAIFTIHNNEPMLVNCFRNRYRCALSNTGDVCILGSNGAAQTVNQKYTLNPSTAELLLICEYGTEGFDTTTGKTIYYVNIDSIKTFLTETEYEEFCKRNQAMTSSQLLEFLTYISLF